MIHPYGCASSAPPAVPARGVGSGKFGCLARLLAATMSHIDGRPVRSISRSHESIVDKIVDYATITDKMALKVGITRGCWT
jgi:hypothetical protein